MPAFAQGCPGKIEGLSGHQIYRYMHKNHRPKYQAIGRLDPFKEEQGASAAASAPGYGWPLFYRFVQGIGAALTNR
jgi:hypothetical protein